MVITSKVNSTQVHIIVDGCIYSRRNVIRRYIDIHMQLEWCKECHIPYRISNYEGVKWRYICVGDLCHHWHTQWLGACSAPCHYRNHYWLIINWAPRKTLHRNDIKNNAWVTVNNDFWVTSEAICQWFSRVTKSRVKIIGKSPHEWPQKSLFTVTNVLFFSYTLFYVPKTLFR